MCPSRDFCKYYFRRRCADLWRSDQQARQLNPLNYNSREFEKDSSFLLILGTLAFCGLHFKNIFLKILWRMLPMMKNMTAINLHDSYSPEQTLHKFRVSGKL